MLRSAAAPKAILQKREVTMANAEPDPRHRPLPAGRGECHYSDI